MYHDRHEAGETLASELSEYKNNKNAVVIAIPRGGVVVGFEVAKLLNLPLDIIVTKKIGAPGNPEYAIGAMDADGDIMVNEDAARSSGASKNYISSEKDRMTEEIKRRLEKYRGSDKYDLENKIVILVDDGIATGFTTRVAINFLKKQHPSQVILAVPVAPPETIEDLEKEVDEIICPLAPNFLGAVGAYYENFDQTEDEEVEKYLAELK